MAALEADGLLDRAVEALPTAEEMGERRRADRGLERPELAVLLAYAKRALAREPARRATSATTRGSSATCASTSRPPWSSASATCSRSTRCGASSWPRINANHVRQLARPHLRLPARRGARRRAGGRGARLPRRARGHRRRGALGRGRAPAAHRRPRDGDGADAGRRPARGGRDPLVRQPRPPRATSRPRSPRAEAPFARLVAVLPDIGAETLARAPPRRGRRARGEGRARRRGVGARARPRAPAGAGHHRHRRGHRPPGGERHGRGARPRRAARDRVAARRARPAPAADAHAALGHPGRARGLPRGARRAGPRRARRARTPACPPTRGGRRATWRRAGRSCAGSRTSPTRSPSRARATCPA